MSAMDEYKRVCAVVRGKEYWAVERSEVADAADAALAGLEAEVQHQIERREEEKLRAVNAEAALDSFLGPDGGRTVIELRAALAERDLMLEDMQTELLQAALNHGFSVPTLARRRARAEEEAAMKAR